MDRDAEPAPIMWPFKRRNPQIYRPPPRSPAAPAALAALSVAPGPSPWYLQLSGTEIRTSVGRLRWRSAGDGELRAGKSLLTTDAGEVVAVADFYCYMRPFGIGRLLVWHPEQRRGDGPLGDSVCFRVIDAERLRPIVDVESRIADLGGRSRFFVAAGELATAAFSTRLADGVHEVTLPVEMHEAGEVLVLAHSTATGLCLWVVDAAGGHLEVVPQDWFNLGAFDLGYQWVTRMARLPGGDLVGEGIRLGVFRLDASRRRIAEWLVEDRFFQPGATSRGCCDDRASE